MATNVEIYADDVLRRLDWLMSTNAVARRQLQRLVREALKGTRKEVGRAARSAMKTDPRGATQGVRTVTYKKEIGGNVNILTSRRGSVRMREWNKTRKLQPGQWGGNRRARSGRTEQIEGYYGASRAFVLRFTNAGTVGRMTKYGYRGQISGSRWFMPSGMRGMQKAREELSVLIPRAMKELWDK